MEKTISFQETVCRDSRSKNVEGNGAGRVKSGNALVRMC
jgi:hypothetical protein